MATHTRPFPSMATLRGSAERFQTSGPKWGDSVGDALKADTIGGASEGAFNTAALFCTGSRVLMVSVISDAPKTNAFAFTLALRVSEAALSDRPSLGVPQSHSVMTRLRSTPRGLGGVCFGASPFMIRSVQSANIFRCGPIARKKLPIEGPDGPTFVRRSHASSVEVAPSVAFDPNSRVDLFPT